jgi:hypothetical protein
MGPKQKDKSHDIKKCNANSPLAKRQDTGRYIYILFMIQGILRRGLTGKY